MNTIGKQLLFTPVLTLALVPPVFADGPFGLHMGQNWGWNHMLYGGPIMLIFWLLILSFIVMVVRWSLGNRSNYTSKLTETSALQILAERYAKGDIDKTEFNERKRELTS